MTHTTRWNKVIVAANGFPFMGVDNPLPNETDRDKVRDEVYKTVVDLLNNALRLAALEHDSIVSLLPYPIEDKQSLYNMKMGDTLYFSICIPPINHEVLRKAKEIIDEDMSKWN